VPLLEEDVNYWLRQFGGESALTELIKRETSSLENPFPPGYGEDLLENEGR
jgi:hypothetical protein